MASLIYTFGSQILSFTACGGAGIIATISGMTNGNHLKDGRSRFPFMLSWQKGPEAGFTLIELMVALGILAVLAGVVILNIGSFFGDSAKTKTWGTEQHQVSSAAGLYRVAGNIIPQPFTVGPPPLGKKVLDPYLLGQLQYTWIIGTDGSVNPTEAYLFSSDLNSLDGFTSLRGSWLAGGGVLRPTGSSENRLVANGGPWEDFIFEATATLLSGNSSGYGMYYRCTSDPNITGYVFQFDPGLGNQFVVRKVMQGQEFPPFQAVPMPAGFPLNGEHKISVSVQGIHHTIKVDGATVLDFDDNQFRSGTVGTRSWSNNSFTEVNFTEFKVSPQ